MKRALLVLMLLGVTACSRDKDWTSITTVSHHRPEIYGSYTAGCLDGAMALPLHGTGYHVENTPRNRFYGHPSLIRFLERYAAANDAQTRQTVYISDMAQPRGGPIAHGHNSHQMGLDVDIWYGKTSEGLPLSLLRTDGASLDEEAWKSFDARLLKNAAHFPEVERILVNPSIKAKLCSRYKGEPWLRKIRPWWAHHNHYHVRLACPAGNPSCIPQQAVAQTDGCDATLDWWFTEEAKQDGMKRTTQTPQPITLPKQCDAVFTSK